MKDRLIKQLDDADLFLRNRANAKPDPLNKYDIAILKDIAETCDKAARALERAIVPPCKVGDKIYIAAEVTKKIIECTIIGCWMCEGNCTVITDCGAIYNLSFNETVFLTKEEAEQALRKEDEGK